MDNYGRRDFLKIGAVSSGVFTGSGMKKGHAAEEDIEKIHYNNEKFYKYRWLLGNRHFF